MNKPNLPPGPYRISECGHSFRVTVLDAKGRWIADFGRDHEWDERDLASLLVRAEKMETALRDIDAALIGYGAGRLKARIHTIVTAALAEAAARRETSDG